ncbi:protein kinase [Streptomyces spinoverrucosus]|uniref:non-specific serine/threonine protein kinase n=1 Tax=Streptomyces spinoverrucosus TaxID=284043 RepID=A0A4Y3VRE2_9ACTN|nr:serine/threonine-protein kinase [Streptomyces spinoverrucosus]GEC09427.1 protein kinase [Streptomyces spinoverrucosus]GHB61244.1 protein kinase [Streptomyces spinoverrucosus]
MSDGGEHQRDGRLVGGRYRLIERIGSGGMGTVWRARDELVERDVAVKQPRLPGDPEDETHRRAAHRLYREARAAARVDHPSAVTIHDVVEDDGIPWIVMELIRGESLHELLQRGPVDAPEAARIGLAVLGALRAAHAVGIVHRDVKPANVLLSPHGRVVLTDFGIAHVQGEESLTMSGEFVGSLEFIAPERMSGRSAGPASDLWSLGVLLYAAVEGWSPFRRTTLESTLAAILAADPPEPKQAGPLGPLLVRLLAKDPERRPGAEEAAVALEAVAEGWPEVPDGASTAAQEAAELEGFADDAGTVRLRGEGTAAPEPGTVVPDPDLTEQPLKPTRHPLRHPVPAILLGILVTGGVWLATSSFRPEPDDTSGTERTATSSSAPGPAWIVHREKDMAAVLSLPSTYKEAAREGSADDPPRLVVYDLGNTIQVRLTQWDKAPGSPMTRARQAHATWDGYNGDARTQYTRTSFDGREAVLADTTYNMAQDPTRVMQLVILTEGGRMYELRVDMPKGTPDEKKGTDVFKGARGRLEIDAVRASPTP